MPARNKLTAADFAGTTVSLTNPGGIGTVHSVPRLMKGQGCIIGAGALDYPAEFAGSSQKTLNELAIGKTITLTSTYDHRVIQGAVSGEFLKIVHQLLAGQERFYEDIFAALRIPYAPIHWNPDMSVDLSERIDKTARVQELINAYRVRGHLMADVDPLAYVQREHHDLEIESHGLSFWDLEREFVTNGFGGRRQAKLRDILGLLRDTYCRTIGIEYMHIRDHTQREWFQRQLERPYEKPHHNEQLRILSKLNQAEAFETFLQTKYVGQKRFSLEGGESLIPLLDRVIDGAASDGMNGAAIGMAHRGRLNVLTNIAGKTYGDVFSEFEGALAGNKRGSGDVKYHIGTEGVFHAFTTATTSTSTSRPTHRTSRRSTACSRASCARSRTEYEKGSFHWLPILVHGDAAFAGPGRRRRDAADVSAARLPHRRHDPHRRQQPSRVHHPAAATLDPRRTPLMWPRASRRRSSTSTAMTPSQSSARAELAFAYRQRFNGTSSSTSSATAVAATTRATTPR